MASYAAVDGLTQSHWENGKSEIREPQGHCAFQAGQHLADQRTRKTRRDYSHSQVSGGFWGMGKKCFRPWALCSHNTQMLPQQWQREKTTVKTQQRQSSVSPHHSERVLKNTHTLSHTLLSHALSPTLAFVRGQLEHSKNTHMLTVSVSFGERVLSKDRREIRFKCCLFVRSVYSA